MLRCRAAPSSSLPRSCPSHGTYVVTSGFADVAGLVGMVQSATDRCPSICQSPANPCAVAFRNSPTQISFTGADCTVSDLCGSARPSGCWVPYCLRPSELSLAPAALINPAMPFLCPFYNLTGDERALSPLVPSCGPITLCAGQTITFGTAGVDGAACHGDTYTRLVEASSGTSSLVVSDDAVGMCSFASFTNLGAASFVGLQIRSGCWGASNCGGRVAYRFSGPSTCAGATSSSRGDGGGSSSTQSPPPSTLWPPPPPPAPPPPSHNSSLRLNNAYAGASWWAAPFGTSCSATCRLAGLACTENAWPTSETDLYRIATIDNTVNSVCPGYIYVRWGALPCIPPAAMAAA